MFSSCKNLVSVASCLTLLTIPNQLLAAEQTIRDLDFVEIYNHGSGESASVYWHESSLYGMDNKKWAEEKERREVSRMSLLSERLKSDTTIKSLSVFWMLYLGQKAVSLLAEPLKFNVTLTKLYLDGSFLYDEGAIKFAEALKVNQTLEVLDLRKTGIGPEGVAHLARVLKNNNSLTSLTLSQNSFGERIMFCFPAGYVLLPGEETEPYKGWKGDDCKHLIKRQGINELTEMLKVNLTLLSLDLSCCNLGPRDAHLLAESLQVNASLTELYLSGDFSHRLLNEGASDILGALKVNKTLQYVGISDNEITEEIKDCLAETRRINPEVKISIDVRDGLYGRTSL